MYMHTQEQEEYIPNTTYMYMLSPTSEADQSEPLWSNYPIVVLNSSHIVTNFYFQEQFIFRHSILIGKKF